MNKIDKIIAEEIDKAINVVENDEEKLRNMIFPYVKSASIDADKGMAEVSFRNEKVANSVIDVWRRFWPKEEGYEILSVKPLPMGKNFGSMFAKYNGGACMYRINFKKSQN